MFRVVMIHNDDHPIPDWVDDKLREAGISWEYRQCESRADLERWASDADVLWTNGTRYGLVVEENMDIFKTVGAIIKPGSGTDHIDHEACTKRGIIIAHSPEIVTEPTSDHHIALLFAAVRQVTRLDRLVHDGRWDGREAPPLGQLSGADLGILGFGRIGKAIAKKLSGFEMNTRVCDPFISEDEVARRGAQKVDLSGLLRDSQFIMVACPLTPDTQGLIGERELRTMRHDAILVNVSRERIVDEAALRKALKEKWIAAAALDVVEQHPLKPDSEWLKLENVIITPHVGGARHDYPNYIYVDVVEDIIGMSKGWLPRWIANKDVIPKWSLVEREIFASKIGSREPANMG